MREKKKHDKKTPRSVKRSSFSQAILVLRDESRPDRSEHKEKPLSKPKTRKRRVNSLVDFTLKEVMNRPE
jgi:hypothetical protein